jgi:hypothetical protein
MPQASFGFDDFDKLFRLNATPTVRFGSFSCLQYSILRDRCITTYHILVTMTMQPNNNSISNSSSKHSMLRRGPTWRADECNLAVEETGGELNLNDLKFNDESSVHSGGSVYHVSSISSFGSSMLGWVDHAICSIKDNVESEIVAQSTMEESIRDNAIKIEKDASIRNISMMGDVEFRQFKKQMHDKGMVTTNAINQAISSKIGKRASMDMQVQHARSHSMNTANHNIRPNFVVNRPSGN